MIFLRLGPHAGFKRFQKCFLAFWSGDGFSKPLIKGEPISKLLRCSRILPEHFHELVALLSGDRTLTGFFYQLVLRQFMVMERRLKCLCGKYLSTGKRLSNEFGKFQLTCEPGSERRIFCRRFSETTQRLLRGVSIEKLLQQVFVGISEFHSLSLKSRSLSYSSQGSFVLPCNCAAKSAHVPALCGLREASYRFPQRFSERNFRLRISI